MHKNLSHYNATDFETSCLAISVFPDIVLLPHIMAEVSSLARQIRNPARAAIRNKLKELIETNVEIPISSLDDVRRDEFDGFGLTDAVILQFCALQDKGVGFSLLTADGDLALPAEMLGYSVTNFSHLR